MRRLPTILVALLALACAACGGASSIPGAATPTVTAPLTAPPRTPSVTTEPASTDPCEPGSHSALPARIPATFPTAVRVAPDGRLFWAERDGRVEVWQDGSAHTVATLPTATTEAGGGYSERGLLGLALDPDFATSHLLVLFVSDPDRATQRIVRVHECRGVADSTSTLVTLPAGPDCCHKGGRVAFGPDGMLYVTLGEEHTATAAQDSGDVRGKVLRYRSDGTVPKDGPFGPTNPAYVLGLRNPFGIAFSAAGRLALTVNGPSGDAGSPATGYDTVYLDVARGANLRWPLCYGYDHPLAGACGTGIGPDWSSEAATVVPTGAAWIDAAGPAGLAGHLVVCTYAKGMLVMTPGSPHATASAGTGDCRLDVTQGPDHSVWVSAPGAITRL